MKRATRTATFAIVFSLALVACKSTAPGTDKVLLAAEKTEQATFYLTDSFVRLERATPILATRVPGIHNAAQGVRENAPTAITQLHDLIQTYRAGKGSTNLQRAVAAAEAIMGDALTWIERAAATGDPSATRILADERAKHAQARRMGAMLEENSAGLPVAMLWFVDLSSLIALLRVIGTSGSDLGADYQILRTLYENLKTLWEKTTVSNDEERVALGEAEQAAFGSEPWNPHPGAPVMDPSKPGKK